MAITWTETQRDELNKRMREAGLRPDSCMATKIEGLWQSRHSDILGVALRDIYEAAGFTDIELDVRQADNGEPYTIIRFRLPDATEAAPAPRYYTDSEETFHFVRDSQRLSVSGDHQIVDTFYSLKEANKHANRLNTANTAPIETPVIEAQAYIATVGSAKTEEESIVIYASDLATATHRAERMTPEDGLSLTIERVYTWREVQRIITALMATPPQD